MAITRLMLLESTASHFWGSNKLPETQELPHGLSRDSHQDGPPENTRSFYPREAPLQSLLWHRDALPQPTCSVGTCSAAGFCSEESPQTHRLVSGLNFHRESAWVWRFTHCPASWALGCEYAANTVGATFIFRGGFQFPPLSWLSRSATSQRKCRTRFPLWTEGKTEQWRKRGSPLTGSNTTYFPRTLLARDNPW